ncbi:MAG: SDR family NAD(P)-dependent oxidoreductase [Catalinimonas sp.]
MKDKICLVTGANSGIGKETTRALYAMGATVIMVCRNGNKALDAKMEIEATVPRPGDNKLDVVLGDLGIQAEVRRVADEVAGRYHRLDVLVNNAGLVVDKKQLTPDRIETTFAVNHLAPFILTLRLLPLLRKSAEPRVVNVSSEAHRIGRFRADKLQNPPRYDAMRTYGDTKLANILFTRELSRRLADERITVNALHPGFVGSNFGSGFTGLYNVLMTVAQPFAISQVEGAQTSIYLASSPKVAGITGKYFEKKRVKKPSDNALSDYYARSLWELSERLTDEHWDAYDHPASTATASKPDTPQEAKNFKLDAAPVPATPPAEAVAPPQEQPDALTMNNDDGTDTLGAPPPDKTFGEQGTSDTTSATASAGASIDEETLGAGPPDETFGEAGETKEEETLGAAPPDETFGAADPPTGQPSNENLPNKGRSKRR